MPPITLHMVLARQAASGLAAGALAGPSGAYLLGATTPDIRVLTRQDRLSTHYFDLGEHAHQDSVAAFLADNPRLVDPGNLNAGTRAWVAGYITHLVLDEQYITGVYRRFFAEPGPLGGQMRANVMDRLLQFDLDRRYGDPELRQSLVEALAMTVENIETGFIDTETLDRWRQVTVEIAARNLDWDRARVMIANHLRFAGLQEGESLTSFLDALPALLDDTIAHITAVEVDAFVQRATAAATVALERYLGCA